MLTGKFSSGCQAKQIVVINLGISPRIGYVEENSLLENKVIIAVIDAVEAAGNNEHAPPEAVHPKPIPQAV
jgi:hypothetical protein